MVDSGGVGFERRPRQRHALSEKRRIVELTLHPGVSVAHVARVNGVNANQVFKWRRAYERGELTEPSCSGSRALLPVTLSSCCEAVTQEAPAQSQRSTSGSIHIEFPGRALIRVERGADPILLHSILESLGK
jgi:transposase